MSKSLVGSIVLYLSVICVVKCDTNVKVSAPQKNPDHPNKCWDEPSQTAYSVGSHNPKESCQRIHCYPDFRIKYTSCGTHSAAQGYTIEQDLSKDYPDCCAKLVKAEKKAKRVDVFEASSVKISKFRSKAKSADVPKEKPEEKKPEEKEPEEKPVEKTTETTVEKKEQKKGKSE